MAIKERLVNDEQLDEIPRDLDDLDVVYLEKMKADGIDESLIDQFAALLELDQQSREQ